MFRKDLRLKYKNIGTVLFVGGSIKYANKHDRWRSRQSKRLSSEGVANLRVTLKPLELSLDHTQTTPIPHLFH